LYIHLVFFLIRFYFLFFVYRLFSWWYLSFMSHCAYSLRLIVLVSALGEYLFISFTEFNLSKLTRNLLTVNLLFLTPHFF
jgi:hypothetical protein